jgi:hypothetical protein
MRRLTLILSDLYLPEEAGRGDAIPPTHAMPNLEWLLRFSGASERVGDWRRWLLAETAPGLENLPIASISAYERVDGRALESTWLATPVALEARLDHVRLLDRGLLRLDESERAGCCDEFARVFGPPFRLHDGGERAFFLSGLPAPGVSTLDPARLLGTEIGPALPRREASELRRLWTEIEMWLQGAAFNTARERAGKRRVSALWLWGAASAPTPSGRVEPGRADAAFFGGDPLISGLNRHSGGEARGAPRQLADIDCAAPHVVVEIAALTGAPHESLQSLDANWFAPAKSALATGDIRELDLLANDRRFRIGARPQWKFWRRRGPWLASLTS